MDEDGQQPQASASTQIRICFECLWNVPAGKVVKVLELLGIWGWQKHGVLGRQMQLADTTSKGGETPKINGVPHPDRKKRD